MSIYDIADRANHYLQAEPGFIECKVESVDPGILSYRFTDHLSANAFCLKQEIHGLKVKMRPNDDTVVLEEKQT